MKAYVCVIRDPSQRWHNDRHWIQPFETLIVAAISNSDCLGEVLNKYPRLKKENIQILDTSQIIADHIEVFGGFTAILEDDFANGED